MIAWILAAALIAGVGAAWPTTTRPRPVPAAEIRRPAPESGTGRGLVITPTSPQDSRKPS